jgi:quinolinate synthase
MSANLNAYEAADETAARIERIRAIKDSFGKNLIIAAHHYQRNEIVALADFVGDSYRMAVEASRTDAEYIVICGVRFMAESTAILAKDGQKVLIPDYGAGCPMADMIDRAMAEEALANISLVSSRPVVPVTYMNSWADLKALTGERDGSICTSGNALRIARSYLDAGKSIFFMPDFNLGINTANALGLAGDEVCLVDKNANLKPVVGSARSSRTDNFSRARMFLWDGFCHVHKTFTAAQIADARKKFPDARVIVHPECSSDVVALADDSGSTEAMQKIISASAPRSNWIVGTEGRFVERMAASFPDRGIYPLKTSYCHNMNRIDLANLEHTLSTLTTLISISPDERSSAVKALNTMVRITEAHE